MNDVLDNDSFQILKVTSNEVKPGFTYLHLPDDLNGKSVLELGPGGDQSSLIHEVQKRGGDYTSIDLFPHNTTGDFGLLGDVTTPFNLLPNSFDYVLMVAPAVWGREGVEVGKVLSILENSVDVLKKNPGNFIGALMHLDRENAGRLIEAVSKDQRFDGCTPMCENTGIPVLDNFSRTVPGQEWTFRLIVD